MPKSWTALLLLISLLVDARLDNFQNNRVGFGCGRADHLQCDEVCKTDLFWYGNCRAWDGTNFQCQCFPYKSPLDSRVCAGMQNYCTKHCQQKNNDGGFCYPQSDFNNPRGKPTCMCFGKFLA